MDRDVEARAVLLARVEGVPGYEAIAAELRGPPGPPRAPAFDPGPPPIHRPPVGLIPLAESMAVIRCPDRRKLDCDCEFRWGCARDGAEKDLIACLACLRGRPDPPPA